VLGYFANGPPSGAIIRCAHTHTHTHMNESNMSTYIHTHTHTHMNESTTSTYIDTNVSRDLFMRAHIYRL